MITENQMCLYKDMKNAQIEMLTDKIKLDEDLIRKMENILPELKGKERTAKEFRGMITIKREDVSCRKNLINIINNIPDCI